MSSTPEVLASTKADGVRTRPGLRRYLATSDNWLPRFVRRCKTGMEGFNVPAPWVVVRPLLLTFLTVRSVYYFVKRVFFATPLFKAYCKQYGRGLRTGTFLHWVQGKGDIIIGDNVWLDGLIGFCFAARFSDRPTLIIGDNSGIGHGSRLAIAKQITIGKNVMISSHVSIRDSNGHNTDVGTRGSHSDGRPPDDATIRPVTICDGVWIGQNCIISPGVKIGEGSVVSAGSVVQSHVPPYCVVAGNPAKVLFRLSRPQPKEPISSQQESGQPTSAVQHDEPALS